MAKSRDQKEAIVAQLVDDLQRAKSVVAVDYQGLGVAKLNELRSSLRASGAQMHVVKNKLVVRALQTAQLDKDTSAAKGPTAYLFGFEDEVAPAKIAFQFGKKHKALTLKSGWLGKTALVASDVKALAQLPSKDELIAKTVGTMKAPLSGFVNVLSGNVRGLVVALAAIRDQKA